MENYQNSVGQGITRRRALGAFGAASAAALAAACMPPTSSPSALPASPTPSNTAPSPAPSPSSAAAALPPTPSVPPAVDVAMLDRYYQQWRAVQQVIETLDRRYSSASITPDLQRRWTIVHMLRNLEQFADGQFNFFHSGFKNKDFELSGEFPVAHVLARTIDRISADINAIQLVAEQRLAGNFSFTSNVPMMDSFGNPSTASHLPELLTQTDNLAGKARWYDGSPHLGTFHDLYLKASIDDLINGAEMKDFDTATILTYFTDQVHVRIVPYTQVALIGVPYAGIYDLQAFLTIPHEVGHFRFWHAYSDTNQVGDPMYNVRERFYPYAPPIATTPNWSEEIFADVYAALIGGPLAVLAAMDLAEEHAHYDFRTDAGFDEHFFPYMRPLILIKAIANFGNVVSSVNNLPLLRANLNPNPGKIAKDLLDEWETRLVPRGGAPARGAVVDSFIEFSPGLGTAPVDGMVQFAIEKLAQVVSGGRDWGWTGAFADLTELHNNASNRVAELFAEVGKPNNQEQVTEQNVVVPNTWHPAPGQVPPTWREWAKVRQYGTVTPPVQAGSYGDIFPRTPNTWVPVFGSGGWTTEGPCSSGKH